MRQKNIILTGFMGTGKSTIGRHLASELGYRFVDTDQLIEEQIGQSIAELFEQQGEAAFRQLEQELSETLAQENGLIIATGGGLMLNPLNVKALSRTGHIFCLSATPEDILARITRQQHIRPLLQAPAPLFRIQELLDQRRPCYQQFPQIETSDRSLKQLVTDLVERVRALD